MLKHSFKKINEIDQEIHDIEEKIKDSEEKTRRLKKFLYLKQTIKKFSQKENKTSVETSILDEMLVMHEEEKNALAGHENTNQTLLNVNTANNPSIESISPVISHSPPKQVGDGNSLLQRIKKVELNSVDKNKVLTPAQTPKPEHDANGFVMTQRALANIKLNSVKPKNFAASSFEDKPTELELKLAKQKALVEQKDTLNPNNSVNAENTSGEIPKLLSVQNFERILTNEDLINHKLAKLRRLKSSILSDEELDDLEFKITEDLSSRISIIPEVNESITNSMIFTDEEPSNLNSTVSELDELLEALCEQVSTLDNGIKKPKALLSKHFDFPSKDKPVIVGEIPKLKI